MSNTRILHCSKMIENYYTCIDEKVAGFSHRFIEGGEGDRIYIAVNVGKKSLCGARGILGEVTDNKPWSDADKYIQCFKIKNLEFCNPFELSCLREVDKSWGAKYLQRSKIIRENEAVELLNKEFTRNIIDKPYMFPEYVQEIESKDDQEEECIEIYDVDDENNQDEEEKLDILGTFQTVRFKNETDPIRGLEPLVTEYFYMLFQCFKEKNSILISNNRLFKTVGIKNDNDENILGIKGIPDALLITYDKDSINTPLRINLIEYECYGEGKFRTTQKFNYLNGTVIPQLIRFASTFSVVTDYKIREKTIEKWIDKIIDYIDEDENENVVSKIEGWMKDLNPTIKQINIINQFQKELKRAFESNIKIILIIDELTVEQKETITNVINSFKLSSTSIKGRDNSIAFSSYVVRLEQKVGVYNKDANFALSFQE